VKTKSKRSIQDGISSTTSRRHRQLVLIARSAAQKHCAVKEQAVARSFDERLDAKTLITTPNSDVLYAMSYADLGEMGPLVFDAVSGL
jgi:hypothetical protein